MGARGSMSSLPIGVESEIVKLYDTYGRRPSIIKLAKMFGMSRRSIRGVLRKFDVRTSKMKWLPKEVLEKLYVENNKSGTEIAKIYNLSSSVVYNWMGRYGISRKSNSDASLLRSTGTPIKRELNIPMWKLARGDMLINYVMQNKEEFGFKEVYLHGTKDFDLICVTNDGRIEKVEIEQSPKQAIYHHHKCDKVIAYWGSARGIKIPVVFVDRAKFIRFAEGIFKLVNGCV